MIDFQMTIAGPAGSGIQVTEKIMKNILGKTAVHFFAYREYMSRVRGGSNSTTFRISEKPVHALRKHINILVPLDVNAVIRFEKQISPDGIVITDSRMDVPENLELDIRRIPFSAAAESSGSERYKNSVIAGYICRMTGIDEGMAIAGVKKALDGRNSDVISGNTGAFKRGMDLFRGKSLYKIRKSDVEKFICNGSEAVFTGAVSGQCSMISAYPMSPSTGVLRLGAEYGDKCGITAEQAEDEIAAVNMALGNWYGGGRAMVTTSGGGLALMGEGISLAGMTETPIVIHDAQRPGPATGLPTRTAQEDLNMVINMGHGEFPRIIYAPGDMESLIYYTSKAFYEADKYQVPVFLLTDQYILNSYYDFPKVEFYDKEEMHTVITEKGYKRYVLTSNGISPRGIPGKGDTCFTVTGNMHDENGNITESPEISVKMTEKRLRKQSSLISDWDMPEILKDGRNKVVVTWGSGLRVVSEAVSVMKDWGHVHFNQVYPLDKSYLRKLFSKKTVVIVESNATGQFASMISSLINRDDIISILKYDGRPWNVEVVRERMESIV